MRAEIEDSLAFPADDAILASRKTGAGIEDLLESIVYTIPAPVGEKDAPLRALIFDSYFDAYRGVVALVRIVDGSLKKGQEIRMMATNTLSLIHILCCALALSPIWQRRSFPSCSCSTCSLRETTRRLR